MGYSVNAKMSILILIMMHHLKASSPALHSAHPSSVKLDNNTGEYGNPGCHLERNFVNM